MNPAENAYCRLCAEQKRSDKLINLRTDDGARRDISNKLRRLNTRVDFSVNILPHTVCFVCITGLDTAFQFVIGIDRAQESLSGVFLENKVKIELPDIEQDHAGFSDEESMLVIAEFPEEYKPVKAEADEEKPLKKISKVKVKQEKKSTVTKIKAPKTKVKGLDSIPLSQFKLTWKDYSWLCSYCETEFASVEELKSHAMQFHDACNAYRCTDCRIRKLSLDMFLKHVKRHRKYLKFSCHICFEKFTTVHKSQIHKTEHNTTENSCRGCNTNFTNVADLEQHAATYCKSYKSQLRSPIYPLMQHTEDLTCLLCKKTFKSKTGLQSHLLTHTDRKRDHTCEICGKCFLNKQALAGHIIIHDSARPFQCEICKSAFKTYQMLRNHIGVHDNKKPFACEQCGRCFRLLKQLNSHRIIHTDSLPHVCSYCNKGFRFKTILNQHVRQHTGVKPYSCAICQRDFTNWPNYNKHMKRRHGMDMAKKKHTPDGVCPIDPVTGEVVPMPKNEQILEWKRQVLELKRPKPKIEIPTMTTEEVISNELAELAESELSQAQQSPVTHTQLCQTEAAIDHSPIDYGGDTLHRE